MRRFMASCVIVLMATWGWPTQASADRHGIGNGSGGGWVSGSEPVYTTQETLQVTAKELIADAYADYRAGLMSGEAFASVEEANAAAAGLGGSLISDGLLSTGRLAQKSCPIDDPCPQDQNILSVAHKSQPNGIYCGPASGVMIADYLNAGNSAWHPESLTQTHMADDIT